MPRNLPGSNTPALTWLEAHIEQWSDDPASIGLTGQQTTDLAAQITSARGAYTDIESVRAQSKTLTRRYHAIARAMRASAAAMIADIKHHALHAASPPAVYTAAGITPADDRSPVDPPEKPVITGATLNGDGSVTLDFKGRGPTGTVWIVTRRLDGQTGFSILGQGDSRTKSFSDTTLPAGSRSATYLVQGVRGSTSGPVSGAMTLALGVGSPRNKEMGLAA